MISISRCCPLCLAAGGTLNVTSCHTTKTPPTKVSGCSTSRPTLASGRTWLSRDQTWSSGCWPDSPTITKLLCRFIFRPMTPEPIPACTVEPGCPGWTKKRMRRGNIRECTKRAGTVRRRRRTKSASCVSCSPSF